MRPDGRPHAAGVGALWYDGDLYFTSGPGTRKSRDLAANPACSLQPGVQPVGPGAGRGPGVRGRGRPRHRPRRAGAGRRRVPGGRLAGAGGRRRADRPVQRAERGAAAVARVPPRLPHRGRGGDGRAVRRVPLDVPRLTRPRGMPPAGAAAGGRRGGGPLRVRGTGRWRRPPRRDRRR
ncbi:pyridoxamine 5'-phosphate oxidase family protein [Actinomadura hallensis]|uniref:pyridoxamine 5'-phosphate oxidase family protein n=1 Tax=Actinomadura hallensis TaxID=337895 RepID=UPI003CCC5E9A